jgi:hypothetical protein
MCAFWNFLGRSSENREVRQRGSPKLAKGLGQCIGAGVSSKGSPGPLGYSLLLVTNLRNIRAATFGTLLELDAELVLLQDPEPLQLGGYVLEGIDEAG